MFYSSWSRIFLALCYDAGRPQNSHNPQSCVAYLLFEAPCMHADDGDGYGPNPNGRASAFERSQRAKTLQLFHSVSKASSVVRSFLVSQHHRKVHIASARFDSGFRTHWLIWLHHHAILYMVIFVKCCQNCLHVDFIERLLCPSNKVRLYCGPASGTKVKQNFPLRSSDSP